MAIGLDLVLATRPNATTGIERYALNLFSALREIAPDAIGYIGWRIRRLRYAVICSQSPAPEVRLGDDQAKGLRSCAESGRYSLVPARVLTRTNVHTAVIAIAPGDDEAYPRKIPYGELSLARSKGGCIHEAKSEPGPA